MPAKSGQYLRQYSLLSTTASVAVGTEVDSYLGVNLAGAVAANALGVSNVTREGAVNIVLLGQMPIKVKDGVTIAKGGPVTTDAAGLLIPATNATQILGYALDAVTSASGDYIEIVVNPSQKVV